MNVGQVVEDLDVLPILLLDGEQELLLGFLVVLLLEEDPAEAVEVGGVVLVLVGRQLGVGFALLAVLVERLADCCR